MRTDGNDSETMAMCDGQTRPAAANLFPEPSDSDLLLANVDAVKEDDGSVAELRQPVSKSWRTAWQVWSPLMR